MRTTTWVAMVLALVCVAVSAVAASRRGPKGGLGSVTAAPPLIPSEADLQASHSTAPGWEGIPSEPEALEFNVATRCRESFREIGSLSARDETGRARVIPLYGRPTHVRSARWNLFTETDGRRPVRVPVVLGGRDCTVEPGCDEPASGDAVFLPDYGQSFQVRIHS